MDDPQTEQSLSAIHIDESLEERLKAHGISKRNVRSIIHGIFSDENVLKLLRNVDTTSALDLPEARVTRSKKQQTAMGDIELGDQTDDLDPGLMFPPYIGVKDTNVHTDFHTTLDSTTDIVDINTESCFDGNGEFDWQAWLSEFDSDGKGKEFKDPDEESESDPDYNFLAEVEEQVEEDYRNDRLTRISKRELVDLTKTEKKAKKRKCTDFYPTIREPDGKLIIPEHEVLKPSRANTAKAIDEFFNCKTTKEKLRMMRADPALRCVQVQRKKRKNKVKSFSLSFSNTQLEVLRQQMQQHIQLLTQTCVLEWKQTESFSSAATFLHEIEYFKSESLSTKYSFFNVASLSDATKILKSIECSPPENDGSGSSLDSKARTLAHSKVFMYKELLPKFLHQVVQTSKKPKFGFHEDCLIAYGLNEMSGYYTHPMELMSCLLLPIRSKEEINFRIIAARQGNFRKDLPNSIMRYKLFNILPPPCTNVFSVDAEAAIPPIQMYGDLPEWLFELQRDPKKQVQARNSLRTGKFMNKVKSKKYSARNLKRTDSGDFALFWTRSMDEKILSVCKRCNGPSKEALFLLSCEFPIRTSKQIENRFYQLIKIYSRTVAKTN